ncbi:MAG: hypothetical protein H6977_02485 [Gammaproteobacteria bacterium]|nr:hypothetical protein [Gammaproteobacteria bacterium]MCP5198852.1 hypothetical protein [Gammaproteobacteria bacterium]
MPAAAAMERRGDHFRAALQTFDDRFDRHRDALTDIKTPPQNLVDDRPGKRMVRAASARFSNIVQDPYARGREPPGRIPAASASPFTGAAMTAIDSDLLEEMIRTPVDHFEDPHAVTHDARLSHAQKEAVLEAWAQGCRDKDAPSPRLERAYLGEVERALERLAELRRD